jgi:hypothetical protein
MGMARKEVAAAVDRFRKYCACDDGVYDGFWERGEGEDAGDRGKELLLEDLHVIAHAHSDYLYRRESKDKRAKSKYLEADFGSVLVCHPGGGWFKYRNPLSGNPWLIGIQKRGERGGAVIEVNEDGSFSEKEYKLWVLARDAQFLRRVELGWVDEPPDYQERVEIFREAMKAIEALEKRCG